MQFPLCSDPARQDKCNRKVSPVFSSSLAIRMTNHNLFQFLFLFFSHRADILRISIITSIHHIADSDTYSTQMHDAVSFDIECSKAATIPGLWRYYRALFARWCQYSLLEYRLRFRTGIGYGIRFVVVISPELQSVISYERCTDRKRMSVFSRALAESIFQLGNTLY